MTNNYTVFVSTFGMVSSYMIYTDRDLLLDYKDALLNEKGFITWDKGIIKLKDVIGITKDN
jgi:hypothetical protein